MKSRSRIEYGGLKELSRRLKRLHAMARPLIYYCSGIVFCTTGVLLFADIIKILGERINRPEIIVFSCMYLAVVVYWTIRILTKANK